MANETTTIEVLAEFAGETVARAISTLARGETLAPFGRSRRSALFGYSESNKGFVESGVVGKIDLSASVQAALQWMEYEVPRAEICAIVFDGSLNSDEGRVDAAVTRVASLKRGLLVEVAQPYRKPEGAAGRFAIGEPKYRFAGIAGDGQVETSTAVDTTAFDTTFRNAFRRNVSAGA
jgi:hypothetical protein